jgi:sulfatase-modifying factor enzyme 1
MAYVPGYRWDAFFSYAHVDDAPAGDSGGWVELFVPELEGALAALTGRRDSVSLFRDTALRREDRFSIALDQHLHGSAVLIAVVSPGFDASVFCQRELAMFEEMARKEGEGSPLGKAQRIVPVRLSANAGHRSILKEVEGHDFTGPGSVFPIDPAGPEFVSKVREVAVELVRILDQMADLMPRREPAQAWLGQSERGQMTAVLRTPVLRLNEEDQRTTLLARAFADRAPSLYEQVRRLAGSLDDWIWALLDELEDYGIVDDTDAASTLLDTILGDGLVNPAVLGECRERTAAAWAAAGAHPPAPSTKAEKISRLIGRDTEELVVDDPVALLSAGWMRSDDRRWRRVLLARGHNETATSAAAEPSRLRTLLSFRHRHVLPTTEYLTGGGAILAEHPWRPGQSLATASVPMRIEEAIDCVAQIADALDVAHGHSLLHGQLDPGQVMVDMRRRYATVTGFGYLGVPGENRPLRVWRSPLVDSAYLAPEARHGRPVAASDQYSLAMLFRRMVIGSGAEAGDAGGLDSGGESMPEPLAWVLRRALAEDPAERFSSTMELADALRSALEVGHSASAERAAEHRYLDAMRKECMDVLRGYVTLRGSSEGGRSRDPHRPLTGAGLARVRHPVLYRIEDAHSIVGPRISEDVSEDLQGGGRILLLGEPGSGKTTTLLHAAQEAARLAQRDPGAPIPVVLPLNSFDGGESVDEFAERQMLELGHEPRHLLKDDRLVYFCDGLNEAPAKGRKMFLEFAREARNFVVSCRTRDYEQDLQEVSQVTTVSILPLDPARIQLALESILGPPGEELWSNLGGCPELMARLRKMRRQGEERRFWDPDYVPGYTNPAEDAAWERVRRDGVMELCRNPFLLRVVAEIFLANGTIPRSRSSIFETSVKTLLRRELERPPADRGDDAVEPELDEEEVVAALAGVAELIQSRHQGVGIEVDAAVAAIGRRRGEELAGAILRLAEDASLVSRRGERLNFTHQLLQEYFAGSLMRDAFERGESPFRFFPRDAWWRSHGWEETAVILSSSLSVGDREGFIRWLAPAHPRLLVRCLEEGGADRSLQALPGETREWLRSSWLERVADPHLNPAARVAILQALAAIGDPRPGVGAVTKGEREWPDIEWVEIPGLGASISRYPITAAQFACLADVSSGRPSNFPQTDVTWQQACDFCLWLGEAIGAEVRLPTAVEWTAAAGLAGDGGEGFPWGPFWVEARANVADGSDGDVGDASPVGAFDDQGAPVVDMVGNVWEWCLDRQPSPVSDETSIRTARLAKGGSWRRHPEFARLDYEYWADAASDADDVGFRVVRVGGASE